MLASVGWAGALTVFLAHALAGLLSDDRGRWPRSASRWESRLGWSSCIWRSPPSPAEWPRRCCLHGACCATNWVVFKLALTAVATAVLLMKLGPISALAQSSASAPGMEGLRTSLALHAAGGLTILVAATLLAVYKPAGLTRYGARKLGRERVAPPGWVRAAWVAEAALVVVLVAMVLLGNHAPSAHLYA